MLNFLVNINELSNELVNNWVSTMGDGAFRPELAYELASQENKARVTPIDANRKVQSFVFRLKITME